QSDWRRSPARVERKSEQRLSGRWGASFFGQPRSIDSFLLICRRGQLDDSIRHINAPAELDFQRPEIVVTEQREVYYIPRFLIADQSFEEFLVHARAVQSDNLILGTHSLFISGRAGTHVLYRNYARGLFQVRAKIGLER